VTTTPEFLSGRCQDIYAGSGEAIDWIGETRKNAQRLDRDADGLIEKLRRTRNLCRRLGAAANRPLSMGVFGMSQAGKSYLISTLARDQDGQLKTILDGQELDFIGHINPPGGGKEATGLVTRFTRQANETPKGYPVELTLFTEADVIKVLGNSFFNDFDRERVRFETDPDSIRDHLAALEKMRQPNPTGGLDADDLVDIMDYFDKRFAQSMQALKGDYWPTAIDLAPHLSGPERGKLLSILWGGIDRLTEVYVELRDALATLSNAQTVYAPLDALVISTGDGYAWSADSILNVDVLDRLGGDKADPLTVLPAGNGEIKPATGIARSLLAMLTAEMRFALANQPVAELLETVDLLDFPGYRGRLSIADLDEVKQEVKRDDADPVAQLLLRGKVAYLFERYTDDQEMNVLIMCTRCDTQIEITTLAPVLSTWVHSTQGETPEDRGERKPGLVWVITQLDRRLEPKPGQSETQQRQEWSNMIHITLLERFAQCPWLPNWTNDQPFDNVFMVRKPGFLRSVFETEGDSREQSFLPGQEERLDALRGIFIENDNVKRHVQDAGSAWDAVVKANDGGMERLAHYLGQVGLRETKLKRIDQQIARIRDDVVEHRLGPYFHADGAGETEKKKKIAEDVANALQDAADSFGELITALQPSSEQLRQLYLRADAHVDSDETDDNDAAAEKRPKRAGLVRLPTKRTETKEAAKPVVSRRAWMFAKAIMSVWIKQLKELPDSTDMLHHLNLSSQTLQLLTDELVTASDRSRIEEGLISALQPLEEKRAAVRVRIVDQQVLLARTVVDDFVDYLGFQALPLEERPPSPLDSRKIFEPPEPIAASDLPQLPDDEIPYSGMYILDWIEAFRHVVVGNAGHSAGREITPEQNQRLGEILQAIRGSASNAASA